MLTEKHLRQVINETIYNALEEQKFKEWFGGNGLTDNNGKPLLVYHGSGKDFGLKFDIKNTYDGKHCFTPNKKDALIYTHWDNGDDNWRTINDAYQYLMYKGYDLNTNLRFPENDNLLNVINKITGEKIDEKLAYNIIREFYKREYSNPTLYYCYLRNAEENEYYDNEYNVYDDDDIWIVKKEHVNYKPIPKYPDMSLNTYIE